MPSSKIFKKAFRSIFARLGEDAVYNGTTPCKIGISSENDFVEAYINETARAVGNFSTVSADRVIGSIPNSIPAKRGDTFQVTFADGTVKNYVVESCYDANGYMKRLFLNEQV